MLLRFLLDVLKKFSQTYFCREIGVLNVHHSLMLVVRVIVRGGVESEGREGCRVEVEEGEGYLSFNSIVTYISTDE